MKLKVDRYRLSPLPAEPASKPLPPRPVAVPVSAQVSGPVSATVAASAAPASAPEQAAVATRQPTGTIPDDAFMPEGDEDGFGNQSFVRPAAPSDPDAPAGPEIDGIRQEGLTGRQLRIARRMAQKHNLPATSDFDAVRLLRQAGIDPFGRSAVLELVQGDADPAPEASRALTVPPEANKLPQTVKPAPLPSTEVRAEDSHLAEVRRIQADLVRRRRKRYALLWAKLAIFVLLPTIVAGWYFFAVATPMYTAHSKFVIQQSTAASQMAGLFSGTSFATSQDSVAVQNFLQSTDAMQRLDQDKGFRAHFSDPKIDPLQRLSPEAGNGAAYSLYSKYVIVSYDPTEGLINLEVSAADPNVAVEFSTALIGYAEERVDQLSAKLRRDQENSAKEAFADATAKLQDAQTNLVNLQTKYKTLSSEVEAGLVTSQIAALDSQLLQERLALAQIQSNAEPNQARLDPVKTRIATLEAEIAKLRSGLTETEGAGPSLATVQSDLAMATAEVATRQMMLAQATSAMETSRIEAQRQTRYLELAVRPVPPDSASYPKAFEDTLVVMLIFLGLYLMVSMTAAILREQVSG
ncbi:capsule biosynthesis protein [Stagnihabitans tardus]|nr:capsule biosynthesis protein [Stagnihabitans tardus]